MVVHKLTPYLQYMLGLCGKGTANTPGGRMCAVVSCKRLSYTTVKMLQAVKTVKEALQGDSCKTLQGGHKKNQQLVPAKTFFGRDQEMKGFV